MTIDPRHIDEAALAELRSTLAADDYHLDVRASDRGVIVEISAGPDACADCLVPKPLMRSMLLGALRVPEHAIELRYPADQVSSG